MEYIVLEISDIELEVIPMHELPGLKVIRVLSMSADMQRLKLSVDLLKLALRNSEDWNGIIKYLTMGELIKVIDQWMEKSQEESNRQDQEDEYYNELSKEEEEFEDDLEFERKAMEEYEEEIDEDTPELSPDMLYEAFVSYLEEYPEPPTPEDFNEGEEPE